MLNDWSKTSKIIFILAIYSLIVMAAPVGLAQPIEITYMSWYTGVAEDVEQEVIDLFNQRNPDIYVSKIPGDPRTKLLTMVAGGSPPDVAIINGVDQAHILTDLAVDITSAIERAEINLGAYIPGLVESVMTRNGRYYGLPWGFGFFNLMINDTRFNETGLGSPAADWSLDDMTTAATRLTDMSPEGSPHSVGIWPGFMNPEEPFFMMHGATIIDPTTGTTDIHTPDYYDAVQYVSDLINQQGVATRATFGAAHVRQSFSEGRIGMMGQWQVAMTTLLTTNAHDMSDWSMVYWPKGRGPQTTLGWGHTVSVIQGTRHPEQSTRFVLFWGSDEVEAILAKAGLYPQTLPGLQQMGTDLALPTGYTVERVMGPILRTPERVVIPPFEYPGYIDVSTGVVRKTLIDVVEGRRPARQAFEGIREQVERILKEAKGS